MSHSWILDILDPVDQVIFNANARSNISKGWDVYGVRIDPDFDYIRLVLKVDEPPSEKVENWIYFFDRHGVPLGRQMFEYKSEDKYSTWYDIDLPRKTEFVNLSIEPSPYTEIFWIPGICKRDLSESNSDEEDKEDKDDKEDKEDEDPTYEAYLDEGSTALYYDHYANPRPNEFHLIDPKDYLLVEYNRFSRTYYKYEDEDETESDEEDDETESDEESESKE